MAHFAELDTNTNHVIRVIVVDNHNILDENGNESETVGIAFCKNIFGEDTKWLQCSYNSSFRLNYPGTGYQYYEDYDIFVPPKPYNCGSWTLNMTTGQWDAPVPKPDTFSPEDRYAWDESRREWIPY
jgi:rRNA maturation protein Nop10